MKRITLTEKHISGLSVRTNNASEMQPEKAKIGALHQTFAQQVKVNYEKGACLYGVYCQYESDHTGDFTVLVGSAPDMVNTQVKLENVTIPAGDYLVFSAKGEMPQVVIDIWGEIWGYFSSEACTHTRAFTADFECYTSENTVDVYIAVTSTSM